MLPSSGSSVRACMSWLPCHASVKAGCFKELAYAYNVKNHTWKCWASWCCKIWKYCFVAL